MLGRPFELGTLSSFVGPASRSQGQNVPGARGFLSFVLARRRVPCASCLFAASCELSFFGELRLGRQNDLVLSPRRFGMRHAKAPRRKVALLRFDAQA